MAENANGNGAPGWVASLKAARSAAVPIVALSTSDPWSSVKSIAGLVGESAPVVLSDSVRGLVGVNKAGADFLAQVQGAKAQAGGGDFGPIAAPGPIGVSIPEAAEIVTTVYQGRIVWCLYDADLLLTGDAQALPAVRAVCNVRDSFKSSGKLLVLLGASFSNLSSRLGQDCYYLSDALPRADELRAIITETAQAAESAGMVAAGWSDAVPAAVDAARGLSRFAAEQAASVAISERRALDPRAVYEQKIGVLKSARGLLPEWGRETFADLGGQDRAAWWADSIMRSAARPSLVARIEELEKVIGAAGTDSSGVQSDALAVLLQAFEDRGWSGMVALGPGGSGKSGFSKALGASYNLPCYRVDLGAMRSRYVGDSEERIRLVVDQIAAMSDDRVFVVASCNSLINLPGPLLRRFRAGIWFFDLPTPADRPVILAKQAKAHGLDPSTFPAELLKRPYSGAELRNLCALVRDYGISWGDAASLITPLYISDASTIATLRKDARGRYLNAAAPGLYPGAVDGPGAGIIETASIESGAGLLSADKGRSFTGGA
jgi:hypothetical protein